jgi:hypothetical protein
VSKAASPSYGKHLIVALLLGLNFATSGRGEDIVTTDGISGEVSHYTRRFKLERDSFLKALVVDPKSISPPAVFMGGPYGSERPAGSGVLLPDSEDGMFPSTRPKLQKAVDAFFGTRGVDLEAKSSPTAQIFFVPETGTLHIHGSLRQVLLVDKILKSTTACLRGSSRWAGPCRVGRDLQCGEGRGRERGLGGKVRLATHRQNRVAVRPAPSR